MGIADNDRLREILTEMIEAGYTLDEIIEVAKEMKEDGQI